MTKNFIYILVCLFAFGTRAVAQDARAVAKLDQSAIRIGDQTKLHLTVHQQAKEQFIFPALADTLSGKLQVLGSSAQDTIPDQNDPEKITVTKSFILTGFDAGTFTIPSFQFKGKAAVIQTEELRLVVQSVKVDTTKAIFDIKQPLAVSYTFADWMKDNWQLLLFPLLGILLIAAAVYYWIKRKKDQPVKEVAVPGLPAHTIALNQLTALKDKKLWQQEQVKEYYSELSDVLREYLEKRYAIKTYEKTTEEILTGLRHADISGENRKTLHQLLTLSDLVKFAKEKPVATENERSIEDAMLFVSGTRKMVTETPATVASGTASRDKGTSSGVSDTAATDNGTDPAGNGSGSAGTGTANNNDDQKNKTGGKGA